MIKKQKTAKPLGRVYYQMKRCVKQSLEVDVRFSETEI
jgi:hypothetical protein